MTHAARWESRGLVAVAVASVAVGVLGAVRTFNAGDSGNGIRDYPGAASNWEGGTLPEPGDDISFLAAAGNAGNFLNQVKNVDTNLFNLGSVSADRANWVMEFCANGFTTTTGISIYDASDFRGWFRTIHPDVVTFPATAEHTPVIPRFEATGRARFRVPDAGTKAVISNLFGQGTVKYDTGNGELELVKTSGNLLGMHRGSLGKLTLHSPDQGDPSGVAAVLAKAFSHFDAQNAATFTLEDGKVVEWRSPENAAIRAVPFVAQTGKPYQSYIPIPAPAYVADYLGTGKPVVDFGPLANTSRVDFATCGASALRILKNNGDWRENADEVFVVFADNDPNAGASFINDSYNMIFTRGRVADARSFNKDQTRRSFYGALMHPLLQGRNALDCTVNGCRVPSSCSVSGPKLKVVSMRVGKTDNAQTSESRIGAMARTDFANWGGVVIGELIVFDKPITEDERQTVLAYLRERWLPEDERDGSSIGEFIAYNNTLGVPEGETAVVRNYVNNGTKLTKEDAGTVAFGAVTKNTLSVDVRGGNVGFARYPAVSADPKPAAHAAFHFDADDLDSFTFEEGAGGVRYVARWQDQNDPSKVAVPVTNLNQKVTNGGEAIRPTAKPTYVADGCNGKPTVYFGTYRNLASIKESGYGDSSALVFRNKNEGILQTCREAFIVVRSHDSGTPFGTDTDLQNLHSTNFRVIDSNYNEESVMGGSWAVNGVPVDGQESVLSSSEFVVLRLSAANGQYINAMALDRYAPGSLGGLRISEAIYYDHGLSDKERIDTEAYLMKKWLGKTHPRQATAELQEVTYAAGLSAEIPVAATAKIDSLKVPSGKLAKTGEGRLTAGVELGKVSELAVEDGELALGDGALVGALAKAAIHMDASDTNSFVFAAGSDSVIERWNDVRGADYGYAYHWNDWGTEGARPSLKLNELNGLPVVDFGVYTHVNGDGAGNWREVCPPVTAGSGLVFSKPLNGTAREGFQIVKYVNGNNAPPIVGNYNNCNFHPDGTRLINLSGANSHTNLKAHAEWSVNKETVDVHTATRSSLGLTTQYNLISFSLEDNLTSYPSITAFAYERHQGAGGWLLAEAIYFSQTLTPEERVAVRDYLLRKWKADSLQDRALSLAKLKIAPTAKLSVPDSYAVSAKDFVGGGQFDGNLTVAAQGSFDLLYAGAGSAGVAVSGTATVPAACPVKITIADGCCPADRERMLVLSADTLAGDVSGWTVSLVNPDGTSFTRRTAQLVREGNAVFAAFYAPGMTILFK